MSEKPRDPDFLVIGAYRAGTTWLHRVLRQHPALWLPPGKELHYFDKPGRTHTWFDAYADTVKRLEAIFNSEQLLFLLFRRFTRPARGPHLHFVVIPGSKDFPIAAARSMRSCPTAVASDHMFKQLGRYPRRQERDPRSPQATKAKTCAPRRENGRCRMIADEKG